jgi:hypothetical protein
VKFCPDCGEGHDCTAVTGNREDPTVTIARINAERDVKVKQIGARQDHDWNEARVAVAGIEGEAEVEAAIAEAEVIGAAIEAGVVSEESAEPVIIDAPPPADDDGDAEQLPPVGGSPAPGPASSKHIGLGMW